LRGLFCVDCIHLLENNLVNEEIRVYREEGYRASLAINAGEVGVNEWLNSGTRLYKLATTKFMQRLLPTLRVL